MVNLDALKKLPKWSYVAMALGVVGLLWYLKRRNAANGALTTTETSTDTTASDGSSYGDPSSDYGINDASSGIGAGGSIGGQTVSPSSLNPTTNIAWESLATSYLQGFGYTGAQINQALNNWLNGYQATTSDTSLFNLAVAALGEPPEGVPSQPTNTNPVPPGLPGGTTHQPGNPTPGSPPVTHKETFYEVVSGDNLTAIARKLKVSESALYSLNKATIENAARAHGHSSSNNGNLIFAGTRLQVP